MMNAEQINAFTGIGTFIGLIIVGIMNRVDARSASKVRNNIQVMVDGNLGIKLKVIATQARRIYQLTKDMKDEQTAIDAEQMYHLHAVRQAIAEAQSQVKTSDPKEFG